MFWYNTFYAYLFSFVPWIMSYEDVLKDSLPKQTKFERKKQLLSPFRLLFQLTKGMIVGVVVRVVFEKFESLIRNCLRGNMEFVCEALSCKTKYLLTSFRIFSVYFFAVEWSGTLNSNSQLCFYRYPENQFSLLLFD